MTRARLQWAALALTAALTGLAVLLVACAPPAAASTGSDVSFPTDLFVGLGVAGFAAIMGGIAGIYFRLRKLETNTAVDKAVTDERERHRAERMGSIEGEISNVRADMRGEIGKVHGRIDGLHALLVSQHNDHDRET